MVAPDRRGSHVWCQHAQVILLGINNDVRVFQVCENERVRSTSKRTPVTLIRLVRFHSIPATNTGFDTTFNVIAIVICSTTVFNAVRVVNSNEKGH
jgi:hypothetical protein